MEKLNLKSSFVSANGGTIEYVSESGEVLRSVHVPPGVQSVGLYIAMTPPGSHIEVSEGLDVYTPQSRSVGLQGYGRAGVQSAANPDYQPTSASRLERMMRKQLSDMQQATNRIEARAKALEKVERIPQAPKELRADPLQVIEPSTDDAAQIS